MLNTPHLYPGGLAAIRLARQLSLVPLPYPTAKPSRILVIATEVTSTLCRSEIDEMSRAGDDAKANVSLCLFSDGASAMIVGGGEQLKDGGELLDLFFFS
jgi:type III polyketide synthase